MFFFLKNMYGIYLSQMNNLLDALDLVLSLESELNF